jgi:hypothetical protein
VPACSSSPIAAIAQRLAVPAPLAPDQCRSLLDHLAQISDPRHRRGRRHMLVAVLAVAVAAVLAGAKSLTAIGEWASDTPGQVLAAFGVRRDPLTGALRPPTEATVRRVLARIDPDALDCAIGAWLVDQHPPPGTSLPGRSPHRAVAVDGKTLRGSGHHDTQQVHLLAAMDQKTCAVLGQTEVDAKTNEITRFRPLLEGMDLSDTVVTADALHTQREHADWLITHKHAAYLLIVKANQPALRQRLATQPWRQIPVADTTWSWSGRDPPSPSHDDRRSGLPPCRTGAAHHPPGPLLAQPPLARRDGVRGHQPYRHPSQPRPPGRLDPRPLGHRGVAPPPRRHLRRGRLPGPHRRRSPHHGQPAKPRHRHPACPRPPRYRRRFALQRPRRHPPAATPRHHTVMKPPLPHFAGALGPRRGGTDR